MTPRRHSKRKMASSHEDWVRIVPLHVPETVRAPLELAPPSPQLTYRNGPLLSAVEVFVIFWGEAWQQAPQNDLVTRLNQFFDFILTSALMDQLSEYGVPGTQIGHGKRTGTIILTSPVLKSSVQDSAIQQFLQK